MHYPIHLTTNIDYAFRFTTNTMAGGMTEYLGSLLCYAYPKIGRNAVIEVLYDSNPPVRGHNWLVRIRHLDCNQPHQYIMDPIDYVELQALEQEKKQS